MNIWNKLSTILACFILVVLFQNCSSVHQAEEPSASLGSGVACGDLESLFKLSYRPFLQKNCASCHISGGVGKGQFADKDASIAWSAFQLTGFSMISDNAVNPGHNAPFTGTHHQAEVDGLKERWIKGLEEAEQCNADTGGNETVGPRINTAAKAIALAKVGDSKTLEWNLGSEFTNDGGLSAPSIPGAIFSVRVEVVEVLGQIAYYISNPRVKNSSSDIHIESLRIKINGHYVAGETTFNFITADAYKNSDTLLSAGTLVAIGLNRSSDKLALSFGKIETTTLPPPYMGPTVNFAMASQSAASEKGTAQLTVSLSEAPREVLVVTVKAESGTAKVRRTNRDAANPYDNFDWDYTMGTVENPTNTTTLTFLPADPNGGAPVLTKTISVEISDDERDEPNETAVFNITSVQGGVIGSTRSHTLTIPDDDAPKPVNLVLSFSQLMSPGGALRQYCLECHNTVKKEGGYDLSNFPSMLSASKKILVQGSPENSQMYLRIRLQCDPAVEPNCGRMPIGQGLDASRQKQIEDWIRDGARNN